METQRRRSGDAAEKQRRRNDDVFSESVKVLRCYGVGLQCAKSFIYISMNAKLLPQIHKYTLIHYTGTIVQWYNGAQ